MCFDDAIESREVPEFIAECLSVGDFRNLNEFSCQELQGREAK